MKAEAGDAIVLDGEERICGRLLATAGLARRVAGFFFTTPCGLTYAVNVTVSVNSPASLPGRYRVRVEFASEPGLEGLETTRLGWLFPSTDRGRCHR